MYYRWGWPSLIDKVSGRLNISYESVIKNLKTATDIVPSLESAQLFRTWPAMVNGNDDWIPVLGETKSVKNYFIFYFPWMGFTGALISASILADIISNKTNHELII